MQQVYETIATKAQSTGKNLTVTSDIVTNNDIISSYALGYVDSENLPDIYKPCRIINDGETLGFVLDYTRGYYPCGYMGAVYVATGIFTTEYIPLKQSWYKSTTVRAYTTSSTTDTKRRYYNNFYPEYAGYVTRTNSTAYLYMLSFVYNAGSQLVTTGSPQITGWKNIYDFLNNNYTYSFQYSGSTFNVTASDFVDGTAYVASSDALYNVRLFIVGYNLPEKTQTGLHFAVFGMSGNMYGTESTFLIGGNQVNSNDTITIQVSQLDRINPTTTNPTGICGLHGAFDILTLTSMGVNQYLYSGNVLCRKLTSSNLYFNIIFAPEDIKRVISLMCRISVDSVTGGTDSYVDGVTYATHVSNNNEFLVELITGDLSDDSFKSKLRSWQYADDGVAVNDFSPDDIPPYPDPDNPHDPGSDVPVTPPLTEGDSIALQLSRRITAASSFITMYNITPDQLSYFGSSLWTSLADYDYTDPATADVYSNYFLQLSETVTGTLDISALLNYIISVRIYPFSVATLPDLTTLGTTKIYLGTGKMGISVGGTAVRLLTSTIGVVSCGSCVVAPGTPYNDFRDYYNSTVTAFLPYCGSVELNPMEVMHNTLYCYYAIDFYTGECTAYLQLDNGTHTYLVASKSGVIGVLVPITATNSGQVAARHLADNAQDSKLTWSAITNLFNVAANAVGGNIGGIGSAVAGMATLGADQQLLQADRQGRSAVLAPSLPGGTGGAAFMLPDSAYVQIRRGTYSRPSNYASSCAYPSTVSGKLSNFSGYTRCTNVLMTGLTATSEEQAAIKSLLENGVIV